MNEKQPTPISRGVEIQKTKVEKMRDWAMEQHKRVVELGSIVEQSRQEELAKPVEEQDAGKILKYDNQDRDLDEISNELSDLITGAFDKEDELREKWLRLEQRMNINNQE